MPCGQNGCYYPESSRNLMWCMYVNYWRYRCLKPEGVDIIPPPAPAPPEGPEEQIGAPVRIPVGARGPTLQTNTESRKTNNRKTSNRKTSNRKRPQPRPTPTTAPASRTGRQEPKGKKRLK